MTTSVLRMADQQAGRFPDVCVLTGVSTRNAVRLRAVQWSGRSWLLGIPGVVIALRFRPGRDSVSVALPVTRHVWRRWNRRSTAAFAATMFGLGLVAIGTLRLDVVPMILGAIVAAVACSYRTRAARNYWVTCRYDANRHTVSVTPTHAAFDAQARNLFARSLR